MAAAFIYTIKYAGMAHDTVRRMAMAFGASSRTDQVVQRWDVGALVTECVHDRSRGEMESVSFTPTPVMINTESGLEVLRLDAMYPVAPPSRSPSYVSYRSVWSTRDFPDGADSSSSWAYSFVRSFEGASKVKALTQNSGAVWWVEVRVKSQKELGEALLRERATDLLGRFDTSGTPVG